ncbi:MAG: helix-turn-helix transcriptional regulator [Bacteroidales bacterium]|nr:helix-turn-helix transcriptional regulator [Bacteroidales bacterium]
MKNNNLKRMRELRNFSQEYVANQLNISQSNYSRIENGSIKLDIGRLIKLAKLFQVKPHILLECDILYLSGQEYPHNLTNQSQEPNFLAFQKRIEQLEEQFRELQNINT